MHIPKQQQSQSSRNDRKSIKNAFFILFRDQCKKNNPESRTTFLFKATPQGHPLSDICYITIIIKKHILCSYVMKCEVKKSKFYEILINDF